MHPLATSPRVPGREPPRSAAESERLLQVEAHCGVVMARIADRNILADMQVEITAAGGQNEGARDGWKLNDLATDKA